MSKISRYGAYGVVFDNSKVLLTLKENGPFKGLWDLPGGGIEFGESPEETLKRELMEEAALIVDQYELINLLTFNGEYDDYLFHHIGMIYRVTAKTSSMVPEDKIRWVLPSEIKEDELTPFALHHIKKFADDYSNANDCR